MKLGTFIYIRCAIVPAVMFYGEWLLLFGIVGALQSKGYQGGTTQCGSYS